MTSKIERIYRIIKVVPVILCTISITVLSSTVSGRGCSLSGGAIDGYMSRPGDIIIGGTFAIHVDRIYIQSLFTTIPSDLQCHIFGMETYQAMRAFTFAVEEINSNPNLLPNITLGFQIVDTCTVMRRVAQGTLWMLSGKQKITPNYHCNKGVPLAGVIGDSSSSQSILMAHILGLYQMPQISYLATSTTLSNWNLFPSFLRTIPSDKFQMKGLSQLISNFGWSWVGVLATDNDYGQFGVQLVKQEITKVGACVAFVEDILTGKPNRNAPYLAQIIKKSSARIVVVISTNSNFFIAMEGFLRLNVTGITWVASEGWATSALLSAKRFQDVLVGTIGFAIHAGQISDFMEYFKSLHPAKDHNDPFMNEFWEQAFSCKWFDHYNLVNLKGNTTSQECTGSENLGNLIINMDFRLTVNVYNAVYAFATALHNLYDCIPGNGPFANGTCANISSFHPWHLLHYVKHVNFMTKDRNNIYFDGEGNPPGVYDIVNWQTSPTGTTEQEIVGNYNASSPDRTSLTINMSALIWNNGGSQVPISKCSQSCPLGFTKVTLPGKPTCCYDCVQCPQGEISNQTDAVMCQQCSWDTWPDLQQDKCLPRTIEFLSYEELLGLSLVAIAIVSSLVPLGILCIFISHKTSPIVRANNYSLSCLLLVSLFLCFLCSLGFIGYPKPEKCLLRQVTFGMVFALCISCVLAKTITVVVAFTVTRPDSRLRKWTGVKLPYCVIVFCTCIQIFVCVTWLSFFPSFPEFDIKTQPGVLIVLCNEGSVTAFWCMLGYLGILATISFIVAFLARRLPDRFNEAKLITFSMLAFLSVWVSFIPAYLSARGKYTVAMEVFAILSSSWSVVVCIFIPKCFIILFRSKINSKHHLMGKGRFQT